MITDNYNRITIDTKAIQANYKVLLLPFKYGEALPVISYKNNQATITWADGQQDIIDFKVENNRHKVSVTRAGKTIAASK